MKKIYNFAAVCMLALPSLATAQVFDYSSSDSCQVFNAPSNCQGFLPFECCDSRSGFFIGLGGSYNTVKVRQDVEASAATTITLDDTLTVDGAVIGGSIAPFSLTQSTFAPLAQVGYFLNLPNSGWLVGLKFSYQYLGVVATNQNINFPREIFDTIVGGPVLLGNIGIQSVETYIDHELALLAFVGRSFCDLDFYIGGGAVAFGTQTKLYNGFVDVTVADTSIGNLGTLANNSHSEWVWGGIGQIGVSRYFGDSWFVDINYSYAVSGQYKRTSPSLIGTAFGSTVVNSILSVTTKERITSQSFNVSINKAF